MTLYIYKYTHTHIHTYISAVTTIYMYYAIHSPYNVICVLPYTAFLILIACSVTLHQRCLEVNGESLQQGRHLGELEGDNRG
jgi:hypothetical protein